MTAVLRVSEVYLSVQGEGPRVGLPTVFVRFGGCNLRCSGWPCDTQHAIDPAYRHEWTKGSPEEVLERIQEATGGREASYYSICFTGGEPFLQNAVALQKLVGLIPGETPLECFSNGTIKYPKWATDRISFIMDWKLPGSGEDTNNLTRLWNLAQLTHKDVVKFTIAGPRDYSVAKRQYEQHIEPHSDVLVYYGIVWGSQMRNSRLIEQVLIDRLPWMFNMQIHNHVWDREQRGI